MAQKDIQVPGIKMKSKASKIDSDDDILDIEPVVEKSKPARKAKKISYSVSDDDNQSESEAEESFTESMADEESDFE